MKYSTHDQDSVYLISPVASDRKLLRSQQKPKRSAVGKVIPNPVEQDIRLVAHAQNRDEMKEHPHQPRYKTRYNLSSQLHHGTVLSHRGHGSLVFIDKLMFELPGV